MLTRGVALNANLWPYITVAFAGGLAGAHLGSRKFNTEALKYTLAMVLVVAAYKLLLTTA